MFLLPLTACTWIPEADLERLSTEPSVDLAIYGLSPAWGPPDEDTSVTISGSGLSGVSSVRFGRADVDITSTGDDQLVVIAPAVGLETVVDVTVQRGDDEVTLAEAFTYSDDASAGDDTGGGTSGPGQTGGLVSFNLTQYACPDCVGLTTDLEVSLRAAFHAPSNESWFEWLPTLGSCVTDPTITNPTSTFLDAGPMVSVTSGGTALGLTPDETWIYDAQDLTATDFIRNASYDLALPTGGSDVAAFTVTSAFNTPQAISSVTPSDILLTSPRDAFTARISKAEAAFTWSPSGGTDSFLVELQIYSSSGSTYLGGVTCLGSDTGAISVPASVLADYPTGGLVLVGMHRYVEGGFVRPDNGSLVETLVSLGVVGTGTISP